MPDLERKREAGWRGRRARTTRIARSLSSAGLLVALGAALLACRPRGEELLPSSPELHRALDALPPRVLPGPAPGRARLEPSVMRAAEVGTWTVVLHVGRGGVAPGGGFLVELPKSWMALRGPVSKPVQTADPESPHYLGATSSRPETDLDLTPERLGFDSIFDRYPHILAIVVGGAPLREGDEVRVRFAHTTAPYVAGEDEVRVAVDPLGYGEHALLAHGASYRVESGPPEKMLLVAPSDAVVGRPTSVRLTLFDRFFNPAAAAGTVELRGLDDETRTARFEPRSRGALAIPWTPRAEGLVWPAATFAPTTSGAVISIPGNPVRVHREAPRERIVWGDLHSHSGISKDGIGHGSFAFARDAALLDFFASTEHADDDRPHAIERNGITAREWSAVRRDVRDFDAPERFVTLLGYECNLLDGHRCVYFRSGDGVPWPPAQLGHQVAGLWPRLSAGESLAIPHHLGRSTIVAVERVIGPGLDDVVFARRRSTRGEVPRWDRPFPARLQPALEIYSSHGTSERFDPDDALAYESVHYLPSASLDGPHYAWDAWRFGHRVGVVGGSDNHTAQPGLPHDGLTAALVPELTREAVFDAVAARRTYATTGERILLDLRLGEARLGEVLVAEGELAGSVFVAAPREILYAEVVAVPEGDAPPEVSARWEEPGRLLERTITVPALAGPAAVYLRCELVGETEGRVARGWTSPIFVTPRGSGEQTAASPSGGSPVVLAARAP